MAKQVFIWFGLGYVIVTLVATFHAVWTGAGNAAQFMELTTALLTWPVAAGGFATAVRFARGGYDAGVAKAAPKKGAV